MAAAIRVAAALADQGVVSGGNLLMAVVIGRAIGAEALGQYSLLFTALLLASAIQDAALSTSFLARKVELTVAERRRYAAACLVVAIAFALFCIGIAGGLLAIVGRDVGTPWAGWIAVTLIPAFLLREYVRRYEISFLRMGAALQLDATATGVQFAIVGVLLLTHLASLSTVLFAMAAGNGIACVLVLLRRRQEFDLFRMPVRMVLFDIIHLSGWVVVAHILLMVGYQMMPWLVGFQLNVKAAGEYAACATIANAANPMITGFINIMMPLAAEAYPGGPSAIQRALRRDATLLVLLAAAVCAVTIIFSDRVVNLIFGMQYVGSGGLLTLLVVTFFVRTLEVGPYIGCWALRRPEWNAICNAVMIVVALVLAITGIARFGLIGAGLALLTGSAAGVAFRWVAFVKLCSAPPLVRAET